ncbi:MAG: polynucleotide adenylyltransferase PcnB [Zoogloeaceae bacterium]|jgi:poly(A) polymerase|nr:polynucleotide adenylyltransferase PcnB [Zoogloeaceae bacterium]
MLRKFINRVFKRDDASTAREPAVIPFSSHGMGREQISSGSRRVCAALSERGYKAYVVGGAVRDLLAQVTPKDFDVATDATPDEVRRCLRRSRLIGRRFQIVHAYMGQEVIEITTFRGALGEDAKTDAHGRVLRDNVFGSQAEDAARRDFTVNALYFDPATEQILDYHHGVADLKQKTLRVIGDPKTRYREDPVRMLRAIRLAAKLGLAIDPAARRPIREMAGLLENVPAARLSDEIFKLLSSGHAVQCLRQLHAEGLHQGTLPLLDVVLRTPEGERFIMLALADTDARIRQDKSSAPCFLFAALLWREVGAVWRRIRETGEHPLPALHQAMNEVLSAQGQKLAITRRVAGDIKEIWALQPRFEHRVGRRPYSVLEHPRFRAAYDFLRLRAKAGEIDAALPAWWLEFQDADSEARAQLLATLSPEGAKRRKRRRSRRGGKGTQGAEGEDAAMDSAALSGDNAKNDAAA